MNIEKLWNKYSCKQFIGEEETGERIIYKNGFTKAINETLSLPVDGQVIRQGNYRTILIDPPWDIKFIERKVRPNQKLSYDGTMSIEEIAKLPVSELAADECDLFLWTTQTYLPYCFEILKAWGFKYHITITWNKMNGLTQFGFHRRTEFCLYAYKNKLGIEKTGKAIPTHIDDLPEYFEEKSKIHSKKPETLYKLIEAKAKPPRLELFARSKRNGWHVWGNQVESDIALSV